MRLSGLFAIVVLLISFPLFAQHSSSTPPAPGTPPPSAPASTSSAASSSSAASAAASVSHAVSAPAPVTGSASQPSTSSASGHASAASSSESNSSRSGSAARSNDPEVRHPSDPKQSDPKQIENDRIVSSPRIGERPRKDEKETKDKPAPDLRKKICVQGRCEECPSGEAGKNGNCVPTSAMTEDPCAISSGRAASLENDVRTAKAQTQNGCATDPSGDECDDLKQQYNGAVQRYRMLLNQAPANCRALLPDPLAL